MNAYCAETLIEEPAVTRLAEIGWETLACRGAFGQEDTSCLSTEGDLCVN